MFQTKAVEKIKTLILCSITFFSFEKRAVYEIMRENIVEPGRSQMTIWLMRIAGCILKYTLIFCNSYCLSTATMVARMFLNVTFYAHCLSCQFFNTNDNYF